MLVYIVEVIVFLAVLLLEIVAFRNKESFAKIIFVTTLLFLIALVVTFFFEKPQMDFKNYATVEVNAEVQNPKTTYHFKDVTDQVQRSGNIDTSKPGEYELEFEVDTMNGKYTKKQVIKVVDSVAPVITLEGEKEIQISYTKEYEEPGFTALDTYDGDLTENVKVSKNEINSKEYNMVYEVVDFSGNKAQEVRHVIVVDDVAPEIKLNGNHNIYMNAGEEYTEAGATVIDEIDGDISDRLQIDGTVDTSKSGNYIVTYKATDDSGNEATTQRFIMVTSTGKVIPQDGTMGKKGVIYLTFDDGPTLTSTPKILDILAKKGVKATFFVINFDDAKAELIKREHEEGHTVAIHGYLHTYSAIYKSEEAYIENITKMQERIQETIGVSPTITRFPGGSSNTVSRHYSTGIMRRLCFEMVSRGFTYFDWNVDSEDAGSAQSASDVYREVTTHLSKNQANVVLMHDFNENTKTINALEDIIDYGLENGYTFEVITPETQMVTHATNN